LDDKIFTHLDSFKNIPKYNPDDMCKVSLLNTMTPNAKAKIWQLATATAPAAAKHMLYSYPAKIYLYLLTHLHMEFSMISIFKIEIRTDR